MSRLDFHLSEGPLAWLMTLNSQFYGFLVAVTLFFWCPSSGWGQATVSDASIAKVENFVQTSSSSVSGAGWDFRALISFDDAPAGAVTIASPSTGPFDLRTDPFDPDARRGDFSFADKALLDADFPSSRTYTFAFGSGSTHTLALGADDYPALASPPQFTSATYAAAQAIDPTQPFTLGFENRNGALFDFIGITYNEGGVRLPIDVVVSTETGYTIDGDELPANSNLEFNISYTKITGSGLNGASGYILETSLPATTLVPEPATAAGLLGAAVFAVAVLRRRVRRRAG